MNNRKMVSGTMITVGTILIGLYVIGSFLAWGIEFGTIGFFGSILTFPVSLIIYFLFAILTRWFWVHLLWVGVAVWLIYKGDAMGDKSW